LLVHQLGYNWLMSYRPSDEVLEKYAKVLVNFALWGGKGIKKGDFVYLTTPLSALPFYRAIRKAVFDRGGHVVSLIVDDMSGWDRYKYKNATDEQLTFFPENFYKGLVADIDHRIAILGDHNTRELDRVDPKKMLLEQKSKKKLIEWIDRKENAGKHTWTLALNGTPAMAKEAGLSPKEYWDQIIKACYLDYADPVAKWKKVSAEVNRVAKKLTDLKIIKIHVVGRDADIRINIGKDRKWLGGGGRNIPSFEVFTSPDWRGTEGWARFNNPVAKYGPRVEGIELHFKAGRVIKVSATRNEKFFKELLNTDKGSSQLGEFSLTDKRLSRITKPMAEELYDENMGGPYGNMHIAVGKSFEDTYSKHSSNVSKTVLKKLGFNDSVTHTDVISTTDRTVTANLENGKELVIYQKGQFTV